VGLWDRIKKSLGGGPAFDPALTRERVTLVPLDEARLPHADDATEWSVFHDWLEERGDVRAELMRRFEQQDQFDEFLGANALMLMGELAVHLTRRNARAWRTNLGVTWRHGLPVGLSFRMADEGHPVWPYVEQALRLPFFSTVDELGVGLSGMEPLMESEAGVLSAPAAQRLRRLTLGDFTFPDECELSWAELGEVGGVWRTLPQLQHLTLQGTATLGAVDAPALTSFTWVTVAVLDEDLAALEAARWPRLEHFGLWAGSSWVPEQLRPVLGKLPASVTSLSLCNTVLDGAAEQLAALPLASRLVRLDLSKGTLDDEGARALLAHRSLFPSLKSLDVSENYLSTAAVAELGQWVATAAAGQRDTTSSPHLEGERYVVVDERLV
jgi:hypothetical protein